MLIYGGEVIGKNGKARSTNDIYVLNTSTMFWKRLLIMESPKSRHMHTLTKVNNRYYTYGGLSLPDNRILNDLWILNCDYVVWDTTLAEMSGAIWIQKQTTGNIPGPLKGHTSIAYKNYLVIFGGENEEGKVNDNVYFLDTGNVSNKGRVDGMDNEGSERERKDVTSNTSSS